MWISDSYKFKATDVEMMQIRNELAGEGIKRIITTKKGDLCPLHNYGKDSKIDFVSKGEGDYILVSGLYQDRPMSYNGMLRMKRFIEIISTDPQVVVKVMDEIKNLVKRSKRLEDIEV
jgi:hypothetical protein